MQKEKGCLCGKLKGGSDHCCKPDPGKVKNYVTLYLSFITLARHSIPNLHS